MAKYILCDCKCKFQWNNKTRQYEYKNNRTFKKDYSWNHSPCICENSKYSKSITYTTVITCDEIIVSTKMTNTTAMNVLIDSDVIALFYIQFNWRLYYY